MISTTALNGVLALAELALLSDKQYAGAVAVANKIGAPGNYLGKLLQTLSRSGLVCSRKGFGGGFRLAKDPGEISLYDVVEPIERIERWTRCIMGRKECSDEKPCSVHVRWKSVRESYFQFLKETSIKDIVDKHDLVICRS